LKAEALHKRPSKQIHQFRVFLGESISSVGCLVLMLPGHFNIIPPYCCPNEGPRKQDPKFSPALRPMFMTISTSSVHDNIHIVQCCSQTKSPLKKTMKSDPRKIYNQQHHHRAESSASSQSKHSTYYGFYVTFTSTGSRVGVSRPPASRGQLARMNPHHYTFFLFF
jgi:hypothetical protein